MRKYTRITENDFRRIVKQVLNETIGADIADSMWNAHPGSMSNTEFFPKIIPNQFKSTGNGAGPWWVNTCASKMSIAMAKLGKTVPGQYKTEIEYNGVPAGTTFNPSSKVMPGILKSAFGNPTDTITLNGTGAPKEILGRKGFYSLITKDWEPSAYGHTDVWNGSESKNGDHWNVTGTLYFWGTDKITDKWGRPAGDRWYGYDPKTKQWTNGMPEWYKEYRESNKDQWGRYIGDKWYGYDPATKKWTKGIPQWYKEKYPQTPK